MNQGVAIILELLKYIVPAIVVLIASVSIVKRFLNNEVKEKHIAMLRDNQDTTVRLRLQAYERLVMFIERIHPRQLVPRVYQTGMTVSELQGAIVFNIQAEFEHNLSQQIYVSKKVWDTVRGVKEQAMNILNNMDQQLNHDDPAQPLHQPMEDYVHNEEGEMPTEIALNIINEEAKTVLSYGSQA